jgi:hypothetical protein
MSKIINWLIKNGASYVRPASTHTGYYFYKDDTFSVSFYNIDKRVWVFINKNEAGSGGWIYTDDPKRVKRIYKSIFNLV